MTHYTKDIRDYLFLSQSDVCKFFRIPLRTYQRWEKHGFPYCMDYLLSLVLADEYSRYWNDNHRDGETDQKPDYLLLGFRFYITHNDISVYYK